MLEFGFGEWLGSLFGLKRIQDIPQGLATLFAAIVVMIGWWQSARRERRKYQLENAHDHVLQKNAAIQALMPPLLPYLKGQIPFPDYHSIDHVTDGEKLHASLLKILNELEFLAIDAATGRANEKYMVDSQKSLLCAFYILSRDYIESHRIARDHRSLYRNFERFFVRIYIKRVSVIERCLEFALGRPIFRYSYFMFQVRYKERAASRECTGISVRRIGEKFSETCDQSDDWFGLYSA